MAKNLLSITVSETEIISRRSFHKYQKTSCLIWKSKEILEQAIFDQYWTFYSPPSASICPPCIIFTFYFFQGCWIEIIPYNFISFDIHVNCKLTSSCGIDKIFYYLVNVRPFAVCRLLCYLLLYCHCLCNWCPFIVTFIIIIFIITINIYYYLLSLLFHLFIFIYLFILFIHLFWGLDLSKVLALAPQRIYYILFYIPKSVKWNI